MIDGSMRLFDAMNPVEVQKLEFGAISGGNVSVKVEGEVDFEIEGDEDYGVVRINLSCELEIGGLRVATSIDKRLKSDEAAITAEICDVVELGDHGSLEKVPGGVVFPISA